MPTKKLPGTDYIYERISDDSRLTGYQAKVRRKGFPSQTKTFDDLEEAKVFVRQVLHDQDRGHKVDRLASHRTTVGDVIDEAIADIDNGVRKAKGARDERYRLTAFRRNFVQLCATSLANATEDMFEDWIEERLEVIKPNSVLREFRHLKPLFETAARKFDLRCSPMAFIKPPREIDERVRRLDIDEEVLLFAELRKAQDPIVAMAADFALEAGCRRSEQLRVEWKHYNAKTGTIWLPDAKNGRGRDILLTRKAQAILESLPGRQEGGTIFKVTGNQLKKAFEYARRRAADVARALGRQDLVQIIRLRWHDFRHEAVSRCFDAGWTMEQVMDFSGHVDPKSLLRYRHPKVDQSVLRLRDMEKNRQAMLPMRADMIGHVLNSRVVINS